MSADNRDLSALSMQELFLLELENQSGILTQGLLHLEQAPRSPQLLESLMRAAHSIKGAARMVDLDLAVRVAHAMEDYFEAARQAESPISPGQIDLMLRCVDLLSRMADGSTAPALQIQTEVEEMLAGLQEPDLVAPDTPTTPPLRLVTSTSPGAPAEPRAEPARTAAAPPRHPETPARDLRVAADNVSRLLGLAGESLVSSRWLDTYTADSARLKRVQYELSRSLDGLRQSLAAAGLGERVVGRLEEARRHNSRLGEALNDRLEEIEEFDRRFSNLSQRLYQEVLDCRMRPFADCVHGLPRMVRDVARSLGKEVKLEITGETTRVDRDILERIEAPLGHLLRNAVDHGIEPPEERRAAQKPAAGSVRVEARHHAGMLLISVEDDGRGVVPEVIRRAVVRQGLADMAVAQQLTEPELLEFLFLPGFTLKGEVTEISGRGVGLDVVRTMAREIGGRVLTSSRPGEGMRIELQLPLTLSVIRGLVVEISGEPYAFPLARVTAAARVPQADIELVEGRQHFPYNDLHIGLVPSHQILELPASEPAGGDVAVVIVGEHTGLYGLVVDRFLGEHELAVRPLDPRLGKVKDISSAALMPDQTPVLVVDVDDLIRSIENLVSGGRLAHVGPDGSGSGADRRKRVLVVDDSLTVRELERKLIASRGYEVDVAVDGMDGWNAARSGQYDLIVTDVDMPRMDGIELVARIKQDARLQSVPIMIVSYKDREEDRRRGLDAGADYYLTKGSFHDETLLQALRDLIGDAAA